MSAINCPTGPFISRACSSLSARAAQACTVSGAAGALAAWFGVPRRKRAARRTRVVLVLAALPTALTFGLELAGLASPSGAIRAICAVPLGAVAGWVFVRSLRAEAVAQSDAL